MLISITAAAPRTSGAVLSDEFVEQHVKPAAGDALFVAGLREAALDWIEGRARLSFERREFVAVFDGSTDPLSLPLGPFATLVAVTYTDTAGAVVDVTAGAWLVGNVVRMSPGQCLPVLRSVSVRFVAGFVDVVPAILPVVAVMLMRHLYDGGSTDDIPPTIVSLLDDGYRTPVIG